MARRPRNGGGSENPINDDPIVIALDKLDQLRGEMRKLGMEQLAALLDLAFAAGLHEYVQLDQARDPDGWEPRQR